jgi:hypothetical protein
MRNWREEEGGIGAAEGEKSALVGASSGYLTAMTP